MHFFLWFRTSEPASKKTLSFHGSFRTHYFRYDTLTGAGTQTHDPPSSFATVKLSFSVFFCRSSTPGLTPRFRSRASVARSPFPSPSRRAAGSPPADPWPPSCPPCLPPSPPSTSGSSSSLGSEDPSSSSCPTSSCWPRPRQLRPRGWWRQQLATAGRPGSRAEPAAGNEKVLP